MRDFFATWFLLLLALALVACVVGLVALAAWSVAAIGQRFGGGVANLITVLVVTGALSLVITRVPPKSLRR